MDLHCQAMQQRIAPSHCQSLDLIQLWKQSLTMENNQPSFGLGDSTQDPSAQNQVVSNNNHIEDAQENGNTFIPPIGLSSNQHEAPPSTEDDDDWSRKVETDEILPAPDGSFRMESVLEQNNENSPRNMDDIITDHHLIESAESPVLRPTQPALTMKEKLVLRERERRIETERARLKRQFAMSNNTEGSGLGEVEGMQTGDADTGAAVGRAESVATLGDESIMVHPDEESAEQERIGFNMERFLRNSDSFNPQLESTDENTPAPNGETGVLMERFLNEDPVVVGAVGRGQTTGDSQRSVSFDVGMMEQNHAVHPIDSSMNVLDVDLGETVTHSEGVPMTTQDEEPRVLQLTQADIEEMAAAEEASIANAPPSDRDDNLSEVGELADFPPNQIIRGDFSDTPTTAMESASVRSVGHGSDKPPSAVSSDRHSVDGAASAADTVAAQPPSERDITSPLADIPSGQHLLQVSDDMKQPPLGIAQNRNEEQEIVNRRLRPGMVNMMAPGSRRKPAPTDNSSPIAAPVQVEGFDFDKHETQSDSMEMNDSFQNLPDDRGWSSRSGDIPVSPIAANTQSPVGLRYGSMEEGHAMVDQRNNENMPLLGDVPPVPEIITRREKSEERRSSAFVSINQSIRSRVNSVFSDVRSEEEDEKLEIHNESEAYLNSSILARAAPERMFALTVTLLLEIPVLLMISGGSDALCELVGRRRYQLLVSFIPLTSAISGNVGLQASTLTTRAISHEHVTEDNFFVWLMKELGASCYLGVGMGSLLGLIAFIASEMDVAFGLTILIAQFVSILTAGCTGTLAPLLFSFIFKRDSGKWGGPLETAIQDIVGSFAMVVLSYKILTWFGPGPIDPSDMCGGSN